MCCVSWLLGGGGGGGVGVCFAGGSGGGALTNVYTGLIIHTDSPPPSYTYTNYTATTHLYTLYTSDHGLLANTRNQVVRLPNCQGRGYQLDMGNRLLKVPCYIQNKWPWLIGGTKLYWSGLTVSTPPPERFRQLIASKLITLSKVDKTNIILIANN